MTNYTFNIIWYKKGIKDGNFLPNKVCQTPYMLPISLSIKQPSILKEKKKSCVCSVYKMRLDIFHKKFSLETDWWGF